MTHSRGKRIEPEVQKPGTQIGFLVEESLHSFDQRGRAKIRREDRRRILMMQIKPLRAVHSLSEIATMQLQ